MKGKKHKPEQIIKKLRDEATLLALAAQLEQAQPWATRTLPPLDA